MDFCFYQQKRKDGGIRTGLDIALRTVWENFHTAADEEDADPVLLWYVDVRGEGDSIPGAREELREWLLEHADSISTALLSLSDEFQAGLDVGTWPASWEVPDRPEGVKLEIVISAARRIDGLEISHVLRELGRNWIQLVGRIPRSIGVS
ncbi:MAG: hypothetical protein WD069_07410 [Planctomycetales bacterium]